MEFLLGLLAIALFLLIIGGSIAALYTARKINHMSRQIEQLSQVLLPQRQRDPAPLAIAEVNGEPATAPPRPTRMPTVVLTPEPPAEPVINQTLTPERPTAGPSLEENLAGRWAVWVGAAALVIGGALLARAAAESGILGPAGRIVLALVLSAIMIGVGEWLRRTRSRWGISLTGPRTAIPQALTGAGLGVAYAAIFAARSLYDLIGPGTTMLGLVITSSAAIGLSLRHGPFVAVVGALGAYAAPLLTGASDAQPWLFWPYQALVGCALLALARARNWAWLVGLVGAGNGLWVLLTGFGLTALAGNGDAMALHALMLAGATVLLLWDDRPAVETGSVLGDLRAMHPWHRWAWLMLALCCTATLVAAAQGDGWLGLWLLGAMVAVTLAQAQTHRDVRWMASVSGTVAALAVLLRLHGLAGPIEIDFADWWLVITRTDSPDLLTGWLVALALTGPALALGLFAGLRSPMALRVVLPAVLAPSLALLLAFLRLRWPDLDSGGAVIAAALCAALALATKLALTKPERNWAATGFFAGAVAALALALCLSLYGIWLTLALAALVPALAWVNQRLPPDTPLRGLRIVAALVAMLVTIRLTLNPNLADYGWLGPIPWTLPGYGLPALGFWWAARAFGRQRDDRFAASLQAAAMAMGILTLTFQIHHLMGNGSIARGWSDWREQALLLSSWLGSALALLWRATRFPRWLSLNAARVAVALLPALHAVFVLGAALVQGRFIFGWPLANWLGFIAWMPGLLLLGMSGMLHLAQMRGGGWHPAWRLATGAYGGAVLFIAATLEVQRAFHSAIGFETALAGIVQTELYLYTLVWLLFGSATLGVGLWRGWVGVRQVGLGLIALTTLKAFLIDLNHLTGMWRAVSLLGLGGALIGLALAYQRLVFRKPDSPTEG